MPTPTATPTLESSLTIMVPIYNIFPNPLNPRKNDAIDSEELQQIIKKRGFEEPVTAYRKSPDADIYVLLAGHRRLYAAKTAGIDEIPVFVVRKPKNTIEEIERIGSLQSGRVNWTAFEWASYTYNLWLEWGKPSKAKFAKDISLSVNAVTDYIHVMQFFPRFEIEDGLVKKELTITGLAALRKWMKTLSKYKPALFDSLGEDMIRKILIEKMYNGLADRDSLRNTEYCKQAAAEDIKEFLTSKNMKLETQIGYLGIKKHYADFNGQIISLGHIKKRIPEIKPITPHQKNSAIKTLEETMALLQAKLNEIKNG